MKAFTYTALDAKEAYKKGRIQARDSKAAAIALEKDGFAVINLQAERKEGKSRLNRLFERVTDLDRIFFTRNLHTMLDAGIALDQAILTTAEQTANEMFKGVLKDIADRIRRGQPLAVALKKHEQHFSNLYVTLVEVGEKSGKLNDTLEYLLEQQEREYELKTKVRAALTYPSVIIFALIAMVTLMMLFVIPKITGVLLDYNVQLPLPTRILIGLTHVITYYGIFILIAFIAAAVGIRKLLERPDWKFRWDTMMLSIPYARGIIKDLNLARFARAMTSLLKSGVSIDRAMELSANTTGNSHYSKAIRGGVPFVRKGAPFAEVLKGHPKLYPPVASRMVEVGEHTGKLDHMLEKIAIFYEKSVTAKLDNLAGVLEPVLLIVVGSAVGFVALSVLMPIWKFSETI